MKTLYPVVSLKNCTMAQLNVSKYKSTSGRVMSDTPTASIGTTGAVSLNNAATKDFGVLRKSRYTPIGLDWNSKKRVFTILNGKRTNVEYPINGLNTGFNKEKPEASKVGNLMIAVGSIFKNPEVGILLNYKKGTTRYELTPLMEDEKIIGWSFVIPLSKEADEAEPEAENDEDEDEDEEPVKPAKTKKAAKTPEPEEDEDEDESGDEEEEEETLDIPDEDEEEDEEEPEPAKPAKKATKPVASRRRKR